MDLTALLNAPWLQPMAGLIVTLIGSWIGIRTNGSAPGTISQSAVAHGEAPITQTVNQHTWHLSEPQRPAPPSPQATPTPRSSDDDTEVVVGLIFAVFIGVAALTWAVASNWTVVSLVLRLLVLLALFVVALSWWHWPPGIVGAWPLRIGVTLVGSAILWALTVLPVPVGGEPSLSTIVKATSGLPVGDSISKTMSLLGVTGVLTYEMRLGGLSLLLVLLSTMARRGLGAALADVAARCAPPRLGLLRAGNWLMGSARMGFGYFAVSAILCTVAVLIIHPFTLGWILSHFVTTTTMLR